MEIVYVKNHQIIFLNHKELVNSHYDGSYKLIGEIFQYLRRRVKLPKNCQAENNILEDSQAAKLQITISDAVQALKDKNYFKLPNLDFDHSRLEKILAEKYDVKKVYGRNNLHTSIVFSMNSNQYVVPPKCIFYNRDVREMDKFLPFSATFDFILMDPPWWNKYIRRIKSAKRQMGYEMLYNETIAEIPLEKLTNENSLVAIWCTNSESHRKAVINNFLPKWKLQLIANWIWVKVDSNGDLICPYSNANGKQPYEQVYVACEAASSNKFLNLMGSESIIVSVPSLIHSHKPPLLDIFRKYLPADPQCLEIFARYLQPNFTSIGLETLKFQDKRFFEHTE